MNKLRLTGLLLTRLLGLLLMCVSCVQVGYAQQSGGGNYPTGNGVRVKEVDGSPNVPGTQTLVFPNGSLTRAGQTVTVTIAGGTTINSTNGQVPYRVNSTTFGDSAISSNALNATGISVTSAAAGSGVTIGVTSSGTHENLIFAPKGANGRVVIPTGNQGLVIGATAMRDVFAPGLHLEGTLPGLSFWDSDATANNRSWEFLANSGVFTARAMDDAITTTIDWIVATRTGTTMNSVAFPNGNVSIGGAPVVADDHFKLQMYYPTDIGLVIQRLATGTDSTDGNIDGAINVKHGKTYAGTSGYAHTYQVYATAGMAGAILGSNNFVGVTAPYAPGPTEQANGFVRFELGPIWPRSEAARFNNSGDFLFGWTSVRTHTASQSGTTITATVGSFSANDVGKFFRWEGTESFVDRITAYTDATHVTVETSRTISSQAGRVFTPKSTITAAGSVGIGDISNPADKLEMGGAIRFGTGTFASNQPRAYVTSDDGLVLTGKAGAISDFLITESSGNTILLNPAGTNDLRLSPVGLSTFGNNGIALGRTITAGGTTGNQTINKSSGTVNFAAGATTLTVTNSLVDTSSIIYCTVRTNDSTASIKSCVPGSGSFVITLTAAATAETSVGFFVTN